MNRISLIACHHLSLNLIKENKEIDPINSLTITDNRTKQTISIPIKNNYIKTT